MKNLITAFALLTFSSGMLAPTAQAKDIVGSKSDLFIKVEKQADMRRFQLCSKKSGSCSTLGRNNGWYSATALWNQRNQEIAETSASVAVTAAVMVAVFYGGAFLAGMVALVFLWFE